MEKYGIQARIGERFNEEIEEIKIARVSSKKSKEKPSTKTITNLIARHKNFQKIIKDITELEEGAFNEK